jgi:hypothetical protein
VATLTDVAVEDAQDDESPADAEYEEDEIA